jgi:hypothetical protein
MNHMQGTSTAQAGMGRSLSRTRSGDTVAVIDDPASRVPTKLRNKALAKFIRLLEDGGAGSSDAERRAYTAEQDAYTGCADKSSYKERALQVYKQLKAEHAAAKSRNAAAAQTQPGQQQPNKRRRKDAGAAAYYAAPAGGAEPEAIQLKKVLEEIARGRKRSSVFNESGYLDGGIERVRHAYSILEALMGVIGPQKAKVMKERIRCILNEQDDAVAPSERAVEVSLLSTAAARACAVQGLEIRAQGNEGRGIRRKGQGVVSNFGLWKGTTARKKLSCRDPGLPGRHV